jgi:hypothetical protein
MIASFESRQYHPKCTKETGEVIGTYWGRSSMYYDKREKLNLYHTIDHIAALNNEWNEFETVIVT